MRDLFQYCRDLGPEWLVLIPKSVTWIVAIWIAPDRIATILLILPPIPGMNMPVQKRLVPLMVAAVLAASCTSTGEPSPRIPQPGGGPASSVPVPSDAADPPTPTTRPADGDFPTPHKIFAEEFTDPLYFDQAQEFAPFGSDEGADTLWFWNTRRHELTNCTTVRWMIEQEDEAGALDDPESNGPDVDGFVIGYGFALILFTGHIDSEGKRLVLDALRRTYSFYAEMRPRESAVMIRDLERFPATDCAKP